ncbi:assimilatory sulfite reductase (NADPH) flavoprotein subunit [Salinivibrio sharmensis]|uniref:Sulfite reductase [NADPH] flavoprotein alpha-component n=1 Tax=Salinivibrio sharmensis TaxID=390883 RepID=A0ABX3KGR7_9GAMM|nr:assimilatory sulfite reductase (NADPH) flavoprotein subunit [Salinivibrio sharmensis]OOE88388.1 sulfite reductase [NADPH] flavoprotein, alpha-component [Salinivibrio sharmensis]
MLLKDLSGLTSPLNDQQIGQLQQAVAELSPQQLAWISGYFWGLSQTPAGEAAAPNAMPQASSAPNQTLTILYASQTGNAKGVAEALHQEAEAAGIPAKLVAADNYKGKQLGKETHLVIVASTNGEGEPPDNAIELHEFLQSKKAPKLDHLHYAVLSLGDSSYEYFCQTGKDFDGFLQKLGAKPMVARLDCDVDYEATASAWREQTLAEVKQQFKASGDAQVVPLHQTTAQVKYTKQSPYTAELLTCQRITGRGSDKAVYHIELDLDESGMEYQPGDALGVWYQNDPELADSIVAKVGLRGDESVDIDGDSLSLRDALIAHYEITASNPQQITALAALSESDTLTALTEDKAALREFANRTQLIDVLALADVSLNVEQFQSILRRLTPRLYSIASSQAEVEDEVHLTVGLVEYQHESGESRQGGASSFLAHRAEAAETVKVFVEHNDNFKLPTSDDTPIIMIGPGTGIAPFRAFLQEREQREAKGDNWLFFGDRTFTDDFLYQVEWQQYLKSGLLTRMDVAFSRDQAEKVYVQHRLLARAEAVWQWLSNGAYIYVCGDANQMAKDVHEALIEIAQTQGQQSREQAETFINELRKDKRYQRDVY